MDDEDVRPSQEITELPKIDANENFGGISFEPEIPEQAAETKPPANIVPPPGIVKTETPKTAPSQVAVTGNQSLNIKPIVTEVPAIHPQTTFAEPKETPARNEPVTQTAPLNIPVPNAPEQKIEEPKEAPTVVQSSLRAIRTYQADVAASVKGQKTSLVRMVIAEQTRKQKISDLESPKSKWNIVFIIAGFVLLLSGTVAAIVVFNKYKQAGTTTEQPTVPSFIFTENTKVLQITGMQTETITRSLAKEITGVNNKLDTIENIALSEDTGGGNNTIATQRLFYLLDNRMSPSLLRSLDKEFMLGVHTFNGNNPFLILKTNFYENTFAGMLGWEQYMARDLFPVFGIEKSPDSQVFIRPFEDKTLKNRDTRVLKDNNGSILLLYTFKDKQTLIITTSSDTMEEVIRRLNSSGPINR